uniref:Uncharacterized protein n=1 Tax=Bradyrhizobium sp. (strain WM9) TaxID=133505 RepID=Q9AQ28_BRASW|nr:hypothetical protein [Bradyrhizobium sp. WM9]
MAGDLQGRCPLVRVEPTCSAERQCRPRSRPHCPTRADANSGERNLQVRGIAQGWNGGWDTSSQRRLSCSYCTRSGMIERNRKVAHRRLDPDPPAMSSRHCPAARVFRRRAFMMRVRPLCQCPRMVTEGSPPHSPSLLHLQLLITFGRHVHPSQIGSCVRGPFRSRDGRVLSKLSWRDARDAAAIGVELLPSPLSRRGSFGAANDDLPMSPEASMSSTRTPNRYRSRMELSQRAAGRASQYRDRRSSSLMFDMILATNSPDTGPPDSRGSFGLSMALRCALRSSSKLSRHPPLLLRTRIARLPARVPSFVQRLCRYGSCALLVHCIWRGRPTVLRDSDPAYGRDMRVIAVEP